MALIMQNRKEHLHVKEALKSTMHLSMAVVGLKIKDSPTREVVVPGNMPLSVFHDRVLCPVFEWTRGYHDFVFVTHTSGYKYGPPKNPFIDVCFGAVVNVTSLINMHGFGGAIRQDYFLLRVDDSAVWPRRLNTAAREGNLSYPFPFWLENPSGTSIASQ